jgi:hypothetical protein
MLLQPSYSAIHIQHLFRCTQQRSTSITPAPDRTAQKRRCPSTVKPYAGILLFAVCCEYCLRTISIWHFHNAVGEITRKNIHCGYARRRALSSFFLRFFFALSIQTHLFFYWSHQRKKIRGISRLTRVPAGKPVEVPAGNRFSAILLDHERASPHIGLDVTFLGVGVWYFMANLFKKTVISKESLRLEDR